MVGLELSPPAWTTHWDLLVHTNQATADAAREGPAGAIYALREG